MKRPSFLLAVPVAVAAVLGGGAVAGQALPRPTPVAGTVQTLASGLVTPLKLDYSPVYGVTVAEYFSGQLTRIVNGTPTPIHTADPGTAVGAVSSRGATTYFVETRGAGEGVPENLYGQLKSIGPFGTQDIVDLAQHEIAENPDGDVRYGFQGLPESCVPNPPAMPDYTGGIDSHPYATAATRGAVYVADAGANAILKVDLSTRLVTTVAVLPPVTLNVPDEATAEAFGQPACVVGHDYLLESVPTDVEVGRDGSLYVTSLPGGPEGGGPALGSVYRLNAASGSLTRLAAGIAGATGVAVGPTGELYVTEMFGNKISVIKPGSGTATTFLEAVTPADVEVFGTTLYATTDALSETGGAQVIRVPINYTAP